MVTEATADNSINPASDADVAAYGAIAEKIRASVLAEIGAKGIDDNGSFRRDHEGAPTPKGIFVHITRDVTGRGPANPGPLLLRSFRRGWRSRDSTRLCAGRTFRT